MNNTKTKDKTFFENYDLYSDANPKDTIRIKYKTLQEVKDTINRLERLYKSKKITHSRNVMIVNVMTQRLRVIVKNFDKGKDRFNLSKRYFEFLKKRTKLKENERYKIKFIL
tara:strand:- start:115 stop:450 length:336 start_codon:yes stop_codon:yes gene_type:complete